jgi:hypothetical protein
MHGVTYAEYQKAIARRRITRQEEPEGMEPDIVQSGTSKKIIGGIVIGVLVIVALVTVLVYSQQPTPTGLTINLTSGKVLNSDSSDVNLAILLSIHNTSTKPIEYYGASYAILDNAAGVDSGIWTDNAVIQPGATKALNETADINLGDALTTTPITTAGSWEVKGTATEQVSGANVTQNFDFNFATQ